MHLPLDELGTDPVLPLANFEGAVLGCIETELRDRKLFFYDVCDLGCAQFYNTLNSNFSQILSVKLTFCHIA